MRLLKFRAKNIKTGKWEIFKINWRSLFNPTPNYESWSQSIDMPGLDVYEGDIIKFDCEGHRQGIIVWENSGFSVYEEGTFHVISCMTSEEIDSFKVIGNIYDNPEYTDETFIIQEDE